MRLFLAIDLDPPARDAFASAIAHVRSLAGDLARDVRWTRAATVHATLAFLGEIDPGRAGALRDALGETLPQPAFALEFSRVGVFPPAGHARVLVLDAGDGRDALMALQQEVAQRLSAAGIAGDRRPFAPHLTLGRVRDDARRARSALRPRLTGSSVEPVRWTVREVVLFESDLSGEAPRYTARERLVLAPAPGTAII